MASIKKRPDGNWRARYRDAAGKEHARHFARKVDAQAWLDGITTAVQTGTYVDPVRGRATVGEMADQWLAGKVALAPTTRALYENILTTHVRPRWGAVRLTAVEYGDIQSWVAGLAQPKAETEIHSSARGLSAAHVRKIAGVLSGILELAVRDRRLPSNPARGVDLPSLSPRRRRYLTAAQVHALAEAAGPGRVVVLVLAYCGLRWSELAALRVRHVDLLRKRLTVEEAMTEVDGGRINWGAPKNKRRRTVALPSFLLSELGSAMADKDRDDLIFTTASGAPLRNRNARRSWWNKAAAAIGEPGLSPHELRHTAASLAVSSGANVKAVQRMLGHASAAMTLDVYADLFDGDLDAVADGMDRLAESARSAPADQVRTKAVVLAFPPDARKAEGQ